MPHRSDAKECPISAKSIGLPAFRDQKGHKIA